MTRFLLIALTSTTLFAQTDFNGTWVMNKAKSDFGQMPEQMIPDKLTMKMISSAEKLKTITTQSGSRGEATTEANYVLDGKTPNANGVGGGEIKSIAKWDGNDITLASSRELQGMTLNIDQRIAKAGPDTILMTTKVAGTPMGDIVMKYYLERVQDGAAPTTPATAAKAAGTPANFAGSWKMNKAKSNFGALPEEFQPTAGTRVITHDDKTASIKSSQSGPSGDLNMNITLKLDGTESVNKSDDGGELKSIAKWDGSSIVVNSKRDVQGMSLDITEKWVKVSDTRMNVETKIGGTPLGDLVMTYAFEKE